MSNFKNITDKFTYFWEIKNLQYCSLQNTEFITSPKFCVPQFNDTEWYFALYPRGRCAESKEKTSCYLRRSDHDNGPENVELKYDIFINSEIKRTTVKNCYTRDSDWGFRNFLPYQLDYYGNSVLITCEIHFIESTKSVDLINSRKARFLEKGIPMPTKCYAQTKFLYDSKFIKTGIDAFINSTCSRVTIPLKLPKKYPSLNVSLQDNLDDLISVSIGLMKEPIEKTLLVVSEIEIRNNIDQLLYSFKNQHTFTNEKPEVWCLDCNIKKSHFKASVSDFLFNKVKFKAVIAFSIGETESEILSVDFLDISRLTPDFPTDKYEPFNGITNLFKENKLFDAVLKVGNEKFNVHKIVLAAESPVFSAMFTNQMTESETSIVDIVDLDEESVKKMISFLYTGSVKELDFESALKLFIAGDKYQISPLLDFCRDAIISHITDDTICNVLSFAHTYSDIKLEKEAVKYIQLNKCLVLSSLDWMIFEKENADLAINILRQICLDS